jgi:hypothetical protein
VSENIDIKSNFIYMLCVYVIVPVLCNCCNKFKAGMKEFWRRNKFTCIGSGNLGTALQNLTGIACLGLSSGREIALSESLPNKNEHVRTTRDTNERLPVNSPYSLVCKLYKYSAICSSFMGFLINDGWQEENTKNIWQCCKEMLCRTPLSLIMNLVVPYLGLSRKVN